MSYAEFLKSKGIRRELKGFKPLWVPDLLFDFQRQLVDWSVRLGRAALFEDCGLGKTIQQLVWAENVVRRQGRGSRVLILAPLAVGRQTVREAAKFGLRATHVRGGQLADGINVTNYEQLGHYRAEDFIGLVADESSILKSVAGKIRKEVIAFANRLPYCLLCTATPSPNDFMELGGSAEALGVMTRNQMLAMFFSNGGETTQQWVLKGHAKRRFWQWVSTWARAVRKPSDLGFRDGKFKLPELNVEHHSVPAAMKRIGLLPPQAKTLNAQRKEYLRTLEARCGKLADLLPTKGPVLAWCHLNAESKLLAKLIPGAVEVCGADPDEVKEERLLGFIDGKYRALVSKPKIAGFGLNLQHCSEVGYFPSYSHEKYYQAIRRTWRFGQKNRVNVRLVGVDSCKTVADAMLRKERQSIELFDGVVREMNHVLQLRQESNGHQEMELPAWLSQ